MSWEKGNTEESYPCAMLDTKNICNIEGTYKL